MLQGVGMLATTFQEFEHPLLGFISWHSSNSLSIDRFRYRTWIRLHTLCSSKKLVITRKPGDYNSRTHQLTIGADRAFRLSKRSLFTSSVGLSGIVYQFIKTRNLKDQITFMGSCTQAISVECPICRCWLFFFPADVWPIYLSSKHRDGRSTMWRSWYFTNAWLSPFCRYFSVMVLFYPKFLWLWWW